MLAFSCANMIFPLLHVAVASTRVLKFAFIPPTYFLYRGSKHILFCIGVPNTCNLNNFVTKKHIVQNFSVSFRRTTGFVWSALTIFSFRIIALYRNDFIFSLQFTVSNY